MNDKFLINSDLSNSTADKFSPLKPKTHIPNHARRRDVHEMCEPGVLQPQSRQVVRQAKAPGWISWGPFLSSISFGQAKEMDSGYGVKPHLN